MSRSFLFLTFLGALLSTLYSKTAAKYTLQELRAGDKNFNLTCVLFDTIGCNLDCKLTSRLYDYVSRGQCVAMNGLPNICHCHHNYARVHPYKKWKKKFDSDYVYQQIMNNAGTAYEAKAILNDPERTGEELKELLDSLLSPYQFSKLKVNDNSLAAKYIKNGKVDRESVQKFISDQLNDLFEGSTNSFQSLLRTNYRDRFKNELTKVRDIGTLYNFVYKVTGLGNKALENDLNEYLEQNNIEKPELEKGEEPLIMNILHYTILNEVIKRNDAAKK